MVRLGVRIGQHGRVQLRRRRDCTKRSKPTIASNKQLVSGGESFGSGLEGRTVLVGESLGGVLEEKLRRALLGRRLVSHFTRHHAAASQRTLHELVQVGRTRHACVSEPRIIQLRQLVSTTSIKS